MKSLRKMVPLALVATLALSGCSTTGVSSHGSNPDTRIRTGFVPHLGSSGETLSLPKSDHALTTEDRSSRFLQLARENFANQNFGLSEKYFRQAVELRTDNASAWAGLAASYDQLGNFEFADRAYQQLHKLAGDSPKYWNNIGYSYLLRGNYKKARLYFGKAQSADPYLDTVQGNLHLLEKTMNG